MGYGKELYVLSATTVNRYLGLGFCVYKNGFNIQEQLPYRNNAAGPALVRVPAGAVLMMRPTFGSSVSQKSGYLRGEQKQR